MTLGNEIHILGYASLMTALDSLTKYSLQSILFRQPLPPQKRKEMGVGEKGVKWDVFNINSMYTWY